MTSHCPKCGSRIPSGQQDCPKCSAPKKAAEAVPMFMVIALLCSSFLLIGTSFVNVQTSPNAAQPNPAIDLNLAAYNAARQFVTDKNKAVQKFSDFSQSAVEHVGKVFVVTLTTDETGDDEKPVRNFYRVEMEYADKNWSLKSLNQ